ncbi:hypothetical protein [Desulfosporosinus sp. FKA]|uniref:hypothetical protein n=1 Tax=Desulfosporosinus sp. FKA TaxID=1969834 RepID=UPI001FA888C4|nr:hypothetical protein [Desulfosporosinus sp. FKA]
MTEKQLTNYSKETIVTMYMALQEITESLKKTSDMQQEQMNVLYKKIDLLLEQVALAKVIHHEMSDLELKEIFGDKWRRLPDEVYKRLAFHPATFEVVQTIKPSFVRSAIKIF